MPKLFIFSCLMSFFVVDVLAQLTVDNSPAIEVLTQMLKRQGLQFNPFKLIVLKILMVLLMAHQIYL